MCCRRFGKHTCQQGAQRRKAQCWVSLQEVYLKRMGLFARKAPLRIAVFFVTAGEVAAFRTVESFSAGPIDVMPVHISDIFPSHA